MDSVMCLARHPGRSVCGAGGWSRSWQLDCSTGRADMVSAGSGSEMTFVAEAGSRIVLAVAAGVGRSACLMSLEAR